MPAHQITAPYTFIDSNGDPVVGGYVKTFEPNGSSTPKALYSDKALTTSAGTTHTLNALGQFTSGPLFGDGDYYFEVYYADDSLADTYEYIEGEGSGNNAATEWVSSVTPTYISATSFSVPGDLTSDFHVNRRVKTENTGGTVYGTIVSSVFSSVTTVTVVNDSGTLDSGLSSVELGFLRADNRSAPYHVQTATLSANADSISLTGINIPEGRHAKLTIFLDVGAGSHIPSLYFNGDTTATNYRRTIVENGTISTANDATLSSAIDGYYIIEGTIIINKPSTDIVCIFHGTRYSVLASSVSVHGSVGNQTTSVITSIDIHSSITGGIGADTIIKLEYV